MYYSLLANICPLFCCLLCCIAIIYIAIIHIYDYSLRNKGWFHLLIRQILKETCLSMLWVLSIVIAFLCKTDIFKFDFEWLTYEYANAINEIIFAVTCGYISGYIIYLLSVIVPKVKRKKTILTIFKERLWYMKGEIESQMCGENTDNVEIVTNYIKKNAQWNEKMNAYQIRSYNVKYLLSFMNSIVSTLNSIMSFADYLDDKDLKLIGETMHHALWYSERLKDSDGGNAYPNEKDVNNLSKSISLCYKNIVKLHSKLEEII